MFTDTPLAGRHLRGIRTSRRLDSDGIDRFGFKSGHTIVDKREETFGFHATAQSMHLTWMSVERSQQ